MKKNLKKHWKKVIGAVVPVLLAGPFVMPPQNTIYRIEHKEAINLLKCKNDYECNKNYFIEMDKSRFPNYEEISGDAGTYAIRVWEDIPASSTIEIFQKLNHPSGYYMGSDLKARTLYGTYWELYSIRDFKKEFGQPIPGQAMAENKILALLMNYALAAIPTDDFESYSTGDLNGNNGGTNWSEAWGATSACALDTWDVVSTPTQGGVRSANIVAAGGGTCQRNFTADTTAGNVFTWYARMDGFTGGKNWYVYNQANALCVMATRYNSSGIQAFNNATWETVSTMNANQWYQINVKVTSYAGKTWQIQIDGGGFSADKTFCTNTAASQVDAYFGEIGGSTNNAYIDTISSGAVANAPTPAPNNKYIPGFMGYLLKKFNINYAIYEKNTFIMSLL